MCHHNINSMKFSVGHLPTGSISDFISLSKSSEDLGYDTLFIADHATKQNPYAMLSLAASNTTRINLGTGVTNPYSRSPLLTASAISTLNSISNGRAILGLGAGGHGISNFSYKKQNPISTLKNSVELIRSLLNSQTISDSGEPFNITNAKLDFKSLNKIPIYLAGRGPKLLELAGAIADGAIAGAGLTSVDAMEYATNRVKLGAKSAGRNFKDIDLVCWSFLSICHDRDTALDAVAPFTAQLVQDAVPRSTLESFGISAKSIDSVLSIENINSLTKLELRNKVPREIIELFAIAGTPQQCLDHVLKLSDIGISHFSILPFNNSENTVIDSIELFHDFVIQEIQS